MPAFRSDSCERSFSTSSGGTRRALPRHQHLVARTLFELAYLPLSHLGRGEIYERLGDSELSARHYARFIELWKNCDPELRPVVEEAERRLAKVGSNEAR